MADFELNMAELIRISNEVNVAICKPIAEQVASRARSSAPHDSGDYATTIRVETDTRDSVRDWARVRVISGVYYGMQVESRHGTLAKALGR